MQFKEIPKKLIVSKRLSQCLNPALPTGVHQRALDVYSHILVVRGVSMSIIAVLNIIFIFLVGRFETGSSIVVSWFVPIFRICCYICQSMS